MTLHGAPTSYVAVRDDFAYDELNAWCAFFTHHDLHREDADLQAEHDEVMKNAAWAAAHG